MLDVKPRKILVGVGQPDDLDGVLEFAAVEAVRRQCGVHLMHAVSAGSRHGDGTELSFTGDTMQHAGTGVLVTAAQRLEELLTDDLSVTTELVHDTAASAINEASPHACLVLLQRRPQPGITHGVRSVTHGVSGRAAVPVLVVPSSWRRDGERTPVVAGVGEPAVSGSLVNAALEMARRARTDLHLVHARPDGHPSGGVEAADHHDFADLLAEYPDVRIESRVERGAPEDTLVAAGDAASLVVIGRHHRKHGMGPRLGSTARAVLERAACPVMVVEPG